MGNRTQTMQLTAVPSGTITAANGAALDVRGLTALSVYAECLTGTSFDIQIEGTNDPAAAKGWAALAIRLAGGGAYAVTAQTVAAGTGKSIYISPDDNVQWVRAVTSNALGTPTGYAFLHGEE